MDVRVGCCGWSEARERYFADFGVIELQDPFYQMPPPALAGKWRSAAPAGFEYCLKAWQLITHTPSSPTYRRLKSAVSPTERELYGSFRPTDQVGLAWERTREIAGVLAASVVLFQCPASFVPNRENVDNFRKFFGAIGRQQFRMAWEPRGGWPAELVRDLCAEFDLLHCVDPFEAEAVYGDVIYWRLHGRGGYRYVYTDDELAWLKERTPTDRTVYVLFNNMSSRTDALRYANRGPLTQV